MYIFRILSVSYISPANFLATYRLVIERPRTSIVQLSSELSLEFRAIERLLPYNREGWGRIGASTIVTTYVFFFIRSNPLTQSALDYSDSGKSARIRAEASLNDCKEIL